MKHPLDVTFYMRGGHEVKISFVDTVELDRDPTTGGYTKYLITWHDGYAPELFTLSLKDIVAVTATENTMYEFEDGEKAE
jgi:hypothetical protein